MEQSEQNRGLHGNTSEGTKSPYPPTKASPKESHVSVCPMFESTILLRYLRSLGGKGPRERASGPHWKNRIATCTARIQMAFSGYLAQLCCLELVFRLVDMFTNESDHVGGTLDASEPRIEDELRHAGSSLNLGLQNV
jgi:hypothetical protein